MLAEQLSGPLHYIMIGVLVLNLTQRKHRATGEKKRIATLLIAVLILIFQVGLVMIQQWDLPSSAILPAFGIVVIIGYFLRNKLNHFTIKCAECGGKLQFNGFLYRDDNRCVSCVTREAAAAAGVETEPAREKGSQTPGYPSRPQEGVPSGIPKRPFAEGEIPKSVEEVDWDVWEFDEKAVLCYLFHEGKVLLIHKKTGLGKGKVNAPGGRVEDDEMPLEAAVREVEEETGIRPGNLEEAARLNFVFTNGYSLSGIVYFADSFSGSMKETEEADPFWAEIDRIPYDLMWEDDQLWLPLAMEGNHVTGRFIFDDDKMLSKDLIINKRMAGAGT